LSARYKLNQKGAVAGSLFGLLLSLIYSCGGVVVVELP